MPSESEVIEYAKWLGMDLNCDQDLFWVAREGLMAPLPQNWKPCKTKDTEDIYYFNFQSGDSTWDHPCDGYYKRLYEQEKKKKEVSMKENADTVRTEAKKIAEELTGKAERKKKKKSLSAVNNLSGSTESAPGKLGKKSLAAIGNSGGSSLVKPLPGIMPKISAIDPLNLPGPGSLTSKGPASLSKNSLAIDVDRSSASSTLSRIETNQSVSSSVGSGGSRLRNSLKSMLSDSTGNDESFERRHEEARSALQSNDGAGKIGVIKSNESDDSTAKAHHEREIKKNRGNDREREKEREKERDKEREREQEKEANKKREWEREERHRERERDERERENERETKKREQGYTSPVPSPSKPVSQGSAFGAPVIKDEFGRIKSPADISRVREKEIQSTSSRHGFHSPTYAGLQSVNDNKLKSAENEIVQLRKINRKLEDNVYELEKKLEEKNDVDIGITSSATVNALERQLRDADLKVKQQEKDLIIERDENSRLRARQMDTVDEIVLELETKLKEKTEKIFNLEDELSKVKKEAMESDLASVKTRTALEASLNDTLDKMKRKASFLDQVRGERDVLRESLTQSEKAEKELEALKEEYTQLEYDLKSRNDQLTAAKLEIDGLRDAQIKNASKSSTDDNNDTATATPTKDSTSESISPSKTSELYDRLKHAEERYTSLEQDYNRLLEVRIVLQGKVSETSAELETIKNELVASQAKVRTLEGQQKCLQNDKDEYENRYQRERDSRLSIQQKLDETEFELSDERSKARRANNAYTSAQEDLVTLQNKLETNEVSAAQTKVNESRIASLEEELVLKNTALEILKKDKASIEESHRRFRESLVDPLAESREMAMIEDTYKGQIDELKQQLTQATEELMEVKKQLAKATKESLVMKEQISMLKAVEVKLEFEQRQNAENTDAIESAQKDKDNLRNDLALLQIQKEQLERDLQNSRSSNINTQIALGSGGSAASSPNKSPKRAGEIEMAKRLQERERQITDLNQELSVQKTAAHNHATREKERSTELDKALKKIKELEKLSESATLSATLSSSSKSSSAVDASHVEDVEHRLSLAVRKNERLEEKIKELTEENDDLKGSIDDYRKSVSNARHAESRLRIELDAAHAELQDTRKQVSDLTVELMRLRGATSAATVSPIVPMSIPMNMANMNMNANMMQSHEFNTILEQQRNYAESITKQFKDTEAKINSLAAHVTSNIPAPSNPATTTTTPVHATDSDPMNLGETEPVLEGLHDAGDGEGNGDVDVSLLKDVIMEFINRRKGKSGPTADTSSNLKGGSSSDEVSDGKYWSQKLQREKKFIREAKGALHRDKESVKWNQSELMRIKNAWKKRKAEMQFHTSSDSTTKNKLKSQGESLNRRTADLNRMVEDIRWTHSWLQDRERKLSKLEKLVENGGQIRDNDDSYMDTLSMLETEMESDLTQFEISAGGSDIDESDNYQDNYNDDFEYSSSSYKFKSSKSRKNAVTKAYSGRALMHRPSTSPRGPWIAPPFNTQVVMNSDQRRIFPQSRSNMNKENNNPTIGISNDSGIKSPPRPSLGDTLATNNAIKNVKNDIKRFSQRCEDSNKAYEDHAQGLSKLLSNINRNVYKLHEKGQLALSEQSLPARFTARLALGAERASANSVEFDM